MPAEGCRRCGISEMHCIELRAQCRPFHPFKRVDNERDMSMCVCYWCQREWEVFWQIFRPDVCAFHSAWPFKPPTAGGIRRRGRRDSHSLAAPTAAGKRPALEETAA